jgi:hypothetical protein
VTRPTYKTYVETKPRAKSEQPRPYQLVARQSFDHTPDLPLILDGVATVRPICQLALVQLVRKGTFTSLRGDIQQSSHMI